jgi:lysozyme
MRFSIALIARPHRALRRAAAAAALVVAATATGAAAANGAVIGPDVSSNNHDNRATVNWATINHAGRASVVFIKATDGGGYRNPTFSSDFAAVRSISVIRGAYHFARPSGVTTAQIASNGAAQATVFSHVVGTLGRPGDLPPVPDLEDAGTLNPAQLSRWTHAWLERAARLTGRDAIVYTNVSFWRQSMANSPEFAMYPLWLADYGVRQPARVGGWKRCVFWQNTETGRMAGAGLNDTMLARQPAGSTRNDATHSRSDLRSWLRAFGMDRSGAIPGY